MTLKFFYKSVIIVFFFLGKLGNFINYQKNDNNKKWKYCLKYLNIKT